MLSKRSHSNIKPYKFFNLFCNLVYQKQVIHIRSAIYFRNVWKILVWSFTSPWRHVLKNMPQRCHSFLFNPRSSRGVQNSHHQVFLWLVRWCSAIYTKPERCLFYIMCIYIYHWSLPQVNVRLFALNRTRNLPTQSQMQLPCYRGLRRSLSDAYIIL